MIKRDLDYSRRLKKKKENCLQLSLLDAMSKDKGNSKLYDDHLLAFLTLIGIIALNDKVSVR